MDIYKFPFGVRVILGLLVLGIIGFVYDIIAIGKIDDYMSALLAIANTAIVVSLVMKTRIGYYGCLVLACLTIIAGFMGFIMFSFILFYDTDNTIIYFVLILIPWLAFWVWAYRYMRKPSIRSLFINEI